MYKNVYFQIFGGQFVAMLDFLCSNEFRDPQNLDIAI